MVINVVVIVCVVINFTAYVKRYNSKNHDNVPNIFVSNTPLLYIFYQHILEL